jgi:hypothetical protein
MEMARRTILSDSEAKFSDLSVRNCLCRLLANSSFLLTLPLLHNFHVRFMLQDNSRALVERTAMTQAAVTAEMSRIGILREDITKHEEVNDARTHALCVQHLGCVTSCMCWCYKQCSTSVHPSFVTTALFAVTT